MRITSSLFLHHFAVFPPPFSPPYSLSPPTISLYLSRSPCSLSLSLRHLQSEALWPVNQGAERTSPPHFFPSLYPPVCVCVRAFKCSTVCSQVEHFELTPHRASNPTPHPTTHTQSYTTRNLSFKLCIFFNPLYLA